MQIALGIESSCDETAAAFVAGDGRVLSHRVRSQIAAHAPFGGVVPEIASREHAAFVASVAREAAAGVPEGYRSATLAGAAVGPGLIGALAVGALFAKGLADGLGLPFYGVDHLEAHALSPRLTAGRDALPFPYALMLLSGGHCRSQVCFAPRRHLVLGTTRDDALGEAFDKTAKLLGLPYPGGPEVEKRAARGNPLAFTFPEPLKDDSADFSFSGLKSAVRRTVEGYGEISEALRDDVCASFQETVRRILRAKTANACRLARAAAGESCRTLSMAGGAASNMTLRRAAEESALDAGFGFYVPPAWLCTDNGAMIAWAVLEYEAAGVAPVTSPGLYAVSR